jgi:hypothetical protein
MRNPEVITVTATYVGQCGGANHTAWSNKCSTFCGMTDNQLYIHGPLHLMLPSRSQLALFVARKALILVNNHLLRRLLLLDHQCY